MAFTPVNDNVKVQLDKAGEFGDVTPDKETGILVAIPEKLVYLGFRSFAWENSFAAFETLEKYYDYYAKMVGKRVYWPALQERGTVFTDPRDNYKYAFIKLTDILMIDEADAPIAPNLYEDKGGMFSA